MHNEAPTGPEISVERYKSLLRFVGENDRVCPKPRRWAELYRLLPDTHQLANGGSEPAVPLILGGWDSQDEEKADRLREHIDWAYQHGALEAVDTFLRSLPDAEWYYGDLWHRVQREKKQIAQQKELRSSTIP